MPLSAQFIIDAIKTARKRKGLTQRDLSTKTKIPQSHISKIEKGSVDLHISSLIEIARTLDLEIMLVPRSLVMTVEALQRSSSNNEQEQIPLYQLDPEVDPNG